MPAVAESLSKLYWPSSLELPSSDETPVDNEDQNFIPNFYSLVNYQKTLN